MSFLHEAAIFLASAIVMVTLFNRIGLGAVLGYLAAGIVIGPWGLGFVTNVENILHFAELGVVLLLFVIGLELQPSRLWVLRRSIFGMGLAQVAITCAVFVAIGTQIELPVTTAAVVGFGLALSSTAFVLQLLAEKKQLNTSYGRAAFAILLFQDLAVIPLLALLPLLGNGDHTGAVHGVTRQMLAGVAAIVLLGVGGRYLLRPVFRWVADSGNHEIFSAASLMLVIGATLLMQSTGLSMGLGAFVAGMLLADSEYRHEVEASIEPFRGLLLGLFFMSVGMSVNLGLLVSEPAAVIGGVAALLAIKFVVVFLLGLMFRLPASAARDLAFVLPQGGEFAFVLFSAAVAYGVLEQSLADLLVLVVSLSMAATPLLFLFNEKVLKPRLTAGAEPVFDRIDEPGAPVIIAGFGRVGQIIGRLLRIKHIPFTALEISQTQVDFVRKYGGKLYYGDASRLDLLRAAHVDQARIFVLAVDDVQASLRIAETVRHNFPNVEIHARVRNRHHAHLLMDLGVKVFVRETYFSALRLAEQVLYGMEFDREEVAASIEKFRRYDEAALIRQHAIHHDENKLIQSVKDAAEELQSLFEADTAAQDAQAAKRKRERAEAAQ
jgi:glutathione-regulated potassium-efflux system ancillary protein KefC/glutathione-regulated potassium-efflux system protein KefB